MTISSEPELLMPGTEAPLRRPYPHGGEPPDPAIQANIVKPPFAALIAAVFLQTPLDIRWLMFFHFGRNPPAMPSIRKEILADGLDKRLLPPAATSGKATQWYWGAFGWPRMSHTQRVLVVKALRAAGQVPMYEFFKFQGYWGVETHNRDFYTAAIAKLPPPPG
jgi:hypothetical protein